MPLVNNIFDDKTRTSAMEIWLIMNVLRLLKTPAYQVAFE